MRRSSLKHSEYLSQFTSTERADYSTCDKPPKRNESIETSRPQCGRCAQSKRPKSARGLQDLWQSPLLVLGLETSRTAWFQGLVLSGRRSPLGSTVSGISKQSAPGPL